MTPPAALADAHRHWSAGDPDRAEEICRDLLADPPQHARALHFLALMAEARGDVGQALDYLEQACATADAASQMLGDLAEPLSPIPAACGGRGRGPARRGGSGQRGRLASAGADPHRSGQARTGSRLSRARGRARAGMDRCAQQSRHRAAAPGRAGAGLRGLPRGTRPRSRKRGGAQQHGLRPGRSSASSRPRSSMPAAPSRASPPCSAPMSMRRSPKPISSATKPRWSGSTAPWQSRRRASRFSPRAPISCAARPPRGRARHQPRGGGAGAREWRGPERPRAHLPCARPRR